LEIQVDVLTKISMPKSTDTHMKIEVIFR